MLCVCVCVCVRVRACVRACAGACGQQLIVHVYGIVNTIAVMTTSTIDCRHAYYSKVIMSCVGELGLDIARGVCHNDYSVNRGAEK